MVPTAPEITPLLVAIANDDGFFQTGDVSGEGMVNGGPAGEGDVRRLVPDEGERQGRLRGGHHQRVVSIEVSDRAVVGAFLDD